MQEPDFIPVECQMLIRKPASEVFEAFINPEITVNFWFTRSSGRLEEGSTVEWFWDMYNVSTAAAVKEIIPDKKIQIEWGDPASTVDFLFSEAEGGTYVIIKNYGFQEQGEELIKAACDSTGGITTVLDGAKAWLEKGLKLNLIADKFPHIKQK